MSEEHIEEKQRDPKLEQNKREEPVSIVGMTAVIGLVGGLFWGAIGYLCYLFSFTEVSPSVILEPLAIGAWKETWLGVVISLGILGVLSIGVALVYYAALKKTKGIYSGMAYGLALFVIVFIVLNPVFPSIKPINEISGYTWITSICLYILYGLFIGYSISYEVNELRIQKEKGISH